jgi:hypothetical protein
MMWSRQGEMNPFFQEAALKSFLCSVSQSCFVSSIAVGSTVSQDVGEMMRILADLPEGPVTFIMLYPGK